MNIIPLLGKTAITPKWRWRSRDGDMHTPAEMETRHLFHTFRMIWNNAVPDHMRVGRVALYRFNPRFYPDWYLAEAVVECWNELGKRDDIAPAWQRELDEMAGHFKPKLDTPTPALEDHREPE